MRKVIVLGLMALFVVASQVPAQAAGRGTSRARVSSGNRPGVFARLMELERAKNAWLFGR